MGIAGEGLERMTAPAPGRMIHRRVPFELELLGARQLCQDQFRLLNKQTRVLQRADHWFDVYRNARKTNYREINFLGNNRIS